ncbi:adenylosuccinate lyase [Hujiaoplasma nucleasis]|uniref:Adenylosuccinate lyase n=1 Tax=Hujiaoplasma nucleasis TaxID=2725268 RepID=A0A7L6N3D6_9MOLU|nr:adenylosuccinate lyase [Hujiaoplasma nucleasis]QLY40786.1 adenylosuccinate lyase [Hujiaoplasma nucleasis]
MIERYQRKVLKDLWSDQHKLECFLQVELANCYAWMKDGLFSKEEFELLKKAKVNPMRVLEIEEETKHDVVAFIKAVSENLGEEKKWLHYGLTSTDVVDSAYALIFKKVNQIILQDIDDFMAVLKEKAFLYKKTPIMGRTHGMHAEITTLGMKFALWYEDFKRLKHKFQLASQEIEVIKLSGAVGTYSTSHPNIQKVAAEYLDLEESIIATQTLQRDRHAFYLSVLGLIGSELEKIATEIRHLSRSELREVSEAFSSKQKGSSAMPHKKNPILSENICGLARVLRGYMHTAFENISLWHERDISHSSTERIIMPDATTLLDFMLVRYTKTIRSLVVYEDKMINNIESSLGLYASQKVMNALVDRGMDRLSVHDYIQKLARKVEEENRHLKDIILEDQYLKTIIDESTLNNLFDYRNAYQYIEHIFNKVFR